jgi:bacterioferritin-associated ferredoxin
MIVCVCRRVSDRDIHRAAREGVPSFDELQAELGVATACGACLDCALDTWSQARCHAPCTGSAGGGTMGGRSGHAQAAGRRVVPVHPLHASQAAAVQPR